MTNNELKEAAASKKKKIDNKDNTPEVMDEVVNTPVVEDDDDAEIFIGNSRVTKEEVAESKVEDDHVGKSKAERAAITEDDLRAVMPDLSDDAFKTASKDVVQNLDKYKKNLVIKNGFTPDEADEAMKNRLQSMGKEINDEYLKENPKLGIIEIDKKNVDKIEFTDEEKAKLTKAKAIKLIAVEDKELGTIKIDKVDKKHKSAYIKTVEGSLSKYSTPVPLIGDYCTFRGAQIIQLMSSVRYEDEGIDELVSKKASLIYDRLVGGTIYQKYNDDNSIKMSYSDFINTFKFHDLDIALYAVLVASSMEETESTLNCPMCNASFPYKYNIKTIMKMDHISDDFKETFDTILRRKNDPDSLEEIASKYGKVLRFKSPYTNNIYDISYPSVARAIRIYNIIDQKDEMMVYLSAFGIFLQSVYLYKKETDSYVQIESDEYKILMETLQTIPQQDISIIFHQMKDMLYTPRFVLDSQCPECGNKMSNDLKVDELIFLTAQDSFTEMV